MQVMNIDNFKIAVTTLRPAHQGPLRRRHTPGQRPAKTWAESLAVHLLPRVRERTSEPPLLVPFIPRNGGLLYIPSNGAWLLAQGFSL